jgi:hypothetical protein
MASRINSRDLSPIISAAQMWMNECLVSDGSAFFPGQSLWTESLVNEAAEAFIDHPDVSGDDFMTKLKKQMLPASEPAQKLMAEMLWALLLFPSNMKARTKRQQIRDVWSLSGHQLAPDHALLSDAVLHGIGSGGPGFNNYRPHELGFLIELTRDLKKRNEPERQKILHDYDAFISWIDSVPRDGNRQFRHMLRYFAFPEQTERISSNNDRKRILEAFKVSKWRMMNDWPDRKLDEELQKLRAHLQPEHPQTLLDFYEPPLRAVWASERTLKTPEGEVTVVVPVDDEEADEPEAAPVEAKSAEARQSFQIQAKLSRIGIAMNFKIWIPKSDRGRVAELLSDTERASLLEELPLNNDVTTLSTIEQIDVIWLKGRSIARAFEVEHTTAVYSGLLRMADLLALQPNMDIRLHIVAPDERREKVFREMLRPVFSLLARGPLSKSCTFVSYESVTQISEMDHLSHMNDSIIKEYEEHSESL